MRVRIKRSLCLHGNAPDKSPVALLLIDVINDFEFEDAEALFKHALPAAKRIAALKQRTNRAGIPSIYVNDNFGKWRSDFRDLVSHCIDDNTRGRPIAELLKPQEEDYFVLKPKQSGFYSTALDLLLKHLGAQTLDPDRLHRRYMHSLYRDRRPPARLSSTDTSGLCRI